MFFMSMCNSGTYCPSLDVDFIGSVAPGNYTYLPGKVRGNCSVMSVSNFSCRSRRVPHDFTVPTEKLKSVPQDISVPVRANIIMT
jgi:hypothetical protein